MLTDVGPSQTISSMKLSNPWAIKKIINLPSWDIIRNLLKYHSWVITRNTRPLPWDTSNKPVVPYAGRTTGTLIISHGRLGEGLGTVILLFLKRERDFATFQTVD